MPGRACGPFDAWYSLAMPSATSSAASAVRPTPRNVPIPPLNVQLSFPIRCGSNRLLRCAMIGTAASSTQSRWPSRLPMFASCFADSNTSPGEVPAFTRSRNSAGLVDLIRREQRLGENRFHVGALLEREAFARGRRLRGGQHFVGLAELRPQLGVLIPQRQLRILRQRLGEKLVDRAARAGAIQRP